MNIFQSVFICFIFAVGSILTGCGDENELGTDSNDFNDINSYSNVSPMLCEAFSTSQASSSCEESCANYAVDESCWNIICVMNRGMYTWCMGECENKGLYCN